MLPEKVGGGLLFVRMLKSRPRFQINSQPNTRKAMKLPPQAEPAPLHATVVPDAYVEGVHNPGHSHVHAQGPLDRAEQGHAGVGKHGIVLLPHGEPEPRRYTLTSWFTCLCCFWPVGIAAVVSSCCVR
jgi:Interferon-induced transmembrane protein